MSKRFVAVLVLALGGWSASRAADVVDGVAAIVNNKIITFSEVRDFVQPLVARLHTQFSGPELVAQVRKAQLDALNTVIERALIIQEFHKKGYTFPENAVDEDIARTIATDCGGNRDVFIKTLEKQSLSLSQYREQVRDRIIVQAMANRKRHQQLVVSPFKMEQYYQDHIGEFKVADQVKLRIIFLKRDPAVPNPDALRGRANEILAKLDAGDSFEGMAKVYSDGKEGKDGGDWGWVNRNDLRSELNDVAFKLKPGQNSRIIDTKEGYYILHVEDIQAAHTKPLAGVRDEIEKILQEQARTAMQAEWVKQLRAKAYIKIPGE